MTLSRRSSKSISTSPATSSSSLSPISGSTSLMAGSSETSSKNSSARTSPNRNAIDLPRTQVASKGGCWTCRLRRKKCDEQREGDSCRTCIRLTIECLGWGPKRPEWMRDKQAVEAYKADIKAQLTRAGLIRGQPRSSMLQAQAATAGPTRTRSMTTHRYSAPATATNSPSSSPSLGLGLDFGFSINPYLDPHHLRHEGLLPGVPGASNSHFHQLPSASFSDPHLNDLDLNSSYFQSPPTTTTLPNLGQESNEYDVSAITHFPQHQQNGGFEFNVHPPPELNFPVVSSQNSIQENHVMYYFENVRSAHFLFAVNTTTNVVYSLIVQEPQGAVTNAVCALASLHFTRKRVAEGLEAPDLNPDHSTAKYFYDESYFQLANAQQIRGHYNESDVIAALHLVYFSQMSGGSMDWMPVLSIALDWLAQIGLPEKEDPKSVLSSLSPAAQIAVKGTMWMDIFASLSLMRPPKHLLLYQRLLSHSAWSIDTNLTHSVSPQMETLTGCPDDVMLAIAEISALAHWKSMERIKGTLNYRDLIHRGDDIEQRLRQRPETPIFEEDPPLHPNLLQPSITDIIFPNQEVRKLLASIFRATALLYLHTVLHDSNPGVSDISASVNGVVQLVHQLLPSNVDRVIVFPICLAACMTDDRMHRDFLKGRIQAQDESIGNLMKTRLLMEAVWQKRDIQGGTVDWRETMRDQASNLILL
ncbi:fungal-specific transcription factor domain-containing protein [Lentinula detonsa]|uniref:Fungal-specific transcription factor domain-containing protein n=1 Tax=Lentinula detonsa TaxID=2804962 RepID=A0A9W8NRB3_9AGAR|nr:fungal-specific transcription factor domain-containing protein [Lentinula detonsa]KAJ3983339.1 fungal-specific transcription factor domain-containing protein [Lentinula detonsa]